MRSPWLPTLTVALILTACGKGQEQKPTGPPATLITSHQVQTMAMDVVEQTTGSLESLVDPKISAEVSGKVLRMEAVPGRAVRQGQILAVLDPADATLAQRADAAEVRRLEALSRQQEKLAERQQQLVAKGFISANAGEDVRAQRDALKEQLAAAQARLEATTRNLGKTRITAPADGVVDTQIASVGDYLRPGDPLCTLVANGKLRAHLPFPESAISRIKRGTPVRLTSPQVPGRVYESKISEIRPGISTGARTMEALVELDSDGSLHGGGSIDARVVIESKAAALAVPEQSVVLRPAGRVVYVIQDGKARQQVVRIGARQAGMIEITEGLKGGEQVVQEGAGFLTDGAPVALKAAHGQPAP